MRNKIFILFAILVCFLHTEKIMSQDCVYWGGVNSTYSYTSSSISISWTSGSNVLNPSVYVSYAIKYKKSSDSNFVSFTKVNVTNLSSTVTGLAASTNYDIRVERYCNGVYTDSSTLWNIKTAAFNEPVPAPLPVTYGCSAYWWGFDSYSTTNNSITLYWTYGGDPSVWANYQVWYRKHNSSTPAAWTKTANIQAQEYTIKDLTNDTEYDIEVHRFCNGIDTDKSGPLSGSITTNGTLGNYVGTWEVAGPSNVRAYEITNTTAKISVMTYPTNNSLIVCDGYGVYYRVAGTSIWMVDLTALFITPSPIKQLIPNTNYEVCVVEYITLNPGTSYSSKYQIQSPISQFKTLPTPGGCGSISGNYSAPAINNDSNTDFYSGTITSASTVTQSSATHTFQASVVYLQTGFNSSISGTGLLSVKSYNFSNCVASKTANRPIKSQVADTNVIAAKIETIETPKEFMIFPNPTNGKLNLVCGKANEIISRIVISNSVGQEVLIQTGNETSIDLGGLTKGLYFYNVETNLGNYFGKVIRK